MGIFDICDYGAVAGGGTINTQAIQKAIDSCHAAGGGKVVAHEDTTMVYRIIIAFVRSPA